MTVYNADAFTQQAGQTLVWEIDGVRCRISLHSTPTDLWLSIHAHSTDDGWQSHFWGRTNWCLI